MAQPTDVSRRVLMGTCGWSDDTIVKCGKFYPASIRCAEDRLRHYSTHFPCVEVDTSTYAIPSTTSIQGWLHCVPKGFLFHFKAFGLFCSKSCPITALPAGVRLKVSTLCREKDYIQLDALTSSIHDELWQIFNSRLQIVHNAGSLGVVVFQFHLSFKPTKENQAHVEWCRKMLDSCFSMAAEFRCRDWFTGQHAISTSNWLEKRGIAIVAADELQHETFQKDRHQTGLPKGQERVRLPIAWSATQPNFMYVRVHRREGRQRLLSDAELSSWWNLLTTELPPKLKGPIYFMWGTDWEDQPIINAKALTQKLGDIAFDWKLAQRTLVPMKRLQSFFVDKIKQASHTTSTKEGSAGGVDEKEEIDCRSTQRRVHAHHLSFEAPYCQANTTAPSAVVSLKKAHTHDVKSSLRSVRRKENKIGKPKAGRVLGSNLSLITSYFSK